MRTLTSRSHCESPRALARCAYGRCGPGQCRRRATTASRERREGSALMGGQSEGTADPSRYERMHTNLNALLTMQPVRHSKQHKALTGAGGLLASSLGCYCPGHCHCPLASDTVLTADDHQLASVSTREYGASLIAERVCDTIAPHACFRQDARPQNLRQGC